MSELTLKQQQDEQAVTIITSLVQKLNQIIETKGPYPKHLLQDLDAELRIHVPGLRASKHDGLGKLRTTLKEVICLQALQNTRKKQLIVSLFEISPSSWRYKFLYPELKARHLLAPIIAVLPAGYVPDSELHRAYEPHMQPCEDTVRKPVASQIKAFESLRNTARVFFSTSWHQLPILPRLNPLIIAPSGTGKSHLVRYLGTALGIPYIKLNFGEWLPLGVREKDRSTMSRIGKFIAENERGLIHLDELDKFRASENEWMGAIIQELFNLLDRQVNFQAADATFGEDLKYKLQHKFMLVGSGTWQDLWDSKTTGFGGADAVSATEIADKVRKHHIIPTELLNRFNSNFLAMGYLTRPELSEIAADIHQRMNVRMKLPSPLDHIEEAYESKKGMRWFEEFYTKALESNPDL